MGFLGDELSLDLRPSFHPRTISDFLKEVSTVEDVSEKVSKLDGFVKDFEEEMKKIDAFKRELPLCVLLLNDAISFLKEETKKCSEKNVRPVMEEEEEERSSTKWLKRDEEMREKKKWVSSFQLWKPDVNHRFPDQKITNRVEAKRNEEGFTNRSSSRQFLASKGFESFSRRKGKEGKEEISCAQGLSLMIPAMKNAKEESLRLPSGRGSSSSAPDMNSNEGSGPQLPPAPLPQQQTLRKQRRCWSPDLHRCFLNALQQLGGPLVATPKQIRELMQVEGLTNDEVKSHLQKYRLHTRKFHSGNSSSTATPEKQSVVVLGGKNLWNSQEKVAGESSKGSSSQSGSPQGPLQLATTTMTGGDSMEEDEETKSESINWRDHHDPKHSKA